MSDKITAWQVSPSWVVERFQRCSPATMRHCLLFTDCCHCAIMWMASRVTGLILPNGCTSAQLGAHSQEAVSIWNMPFPRQQPDKYQTLSCTAVTWSAAVSVVHKPSLDCMSTLLKLHTFLVPLEHSHFGYSAHLWWEGPRVILNLWLPPDMKESQVAKPVSSPPACSCTFAARTECFCKIS